MYSTLQSSPFGRAGQLAQAYHQVGVQTSVTGASPHRLVELLFDGYVEAIAQARGALQNGQIEQKGKAIGRAARIIEEGLKASLNLAEGGRLARDLHDLYDYLTLRLTLANVRNDQNILDECVRLVEPLRQAWKAIGPEVAARLN
jgi:flagellar secretion chaperone FliS